MVCLEIRNRGGGGGFRGEKKKRKFDVGYAEFQVTWNILVKMSNYGLCGLCNFEIWKRKNLLLSLSKGGALGSGIRTPAMEIDRECWRGEGAGGEERGASHSTTSS